MRAATISINGKLHNIPSNFVRIGGKIYFDGDARSVKIKNIKRNGKISLAMNSGKPFFDSRGVLIQGKAKPVEDAELRSKVYDALNEKAFACLRPSYTRYDIGTEKRVRIEIEPERVFAFHFERCKAIRGINLR